MPFRFIPTELPDVILVESRAHRDDRGFFRETYKASEFASNGIDVSFVQDNTSHSIRGVLRGLHYQKNPKAQGKYVVVSQGRVFDVAVDIRKGSPTFARWVGIELSADNCTGLYIPPGFAHGYCVLSDVATIHYKVTAEYAPDLECGILWDDPAIGVKWPSLDPILSPRDLRLPLLAQAGCDFEYGP